MLTGSASLLLLAYNTINSPDMPIGLSSDGAPPLRTGFTLRGNVTKRGICGIGGSGGDETMTVNNRYSSATVVNNVFFGGTWPANSYPARNRHIAFAALVFCGCRTGDSRVNRAYVLATNIAENPQSQSGSSLTTAELGDAPRQNAANQCLILRNDSLLRRACHRR
jgi:hypothetical protein